MLRPTATCAAALALALLLPVPGAAQQSRQEITDRALAEFARERTADLLVVAADPNLAPIDSAWTRAVHYLAETLLIDLDDPDAASLWLRWMERHGPGEPMDADVFRPAAVEAYGRASTAVEGSRTAADAWTRTTWRWPDEVDRSANGVLEVVAGDESGAGALHVSIAGRGTVEGPLGLDPGSYELEVSADGYETANLTREVLPGVTTVLEVDLPPVLEADVAAEVATRLALVAYQQGGRRVCVDGVLDREGMVLTVLEESAGTSGFDVTTAAGTFTGVPVLRRDPATGLAVLRLEGAASVPLPQAGGAAEGQYVWSVHREGCGDPVEARTRLAEWAEPPPGPVRIAPTVPAEAVGAPLVDRTGGILGLVTAADRVAPVSVAQRLLNDAIAALAESPQTEGGGGPPWKLIGGAGAAGVLAAVLLGGGGGPDEPQEGELVIHLPGS